MKQIERWTDHLAIVRSKNANYFEKEIVKRKDRKERPLPVTQSSSILITRPPLVKPGLTHIAPGITK